MNITLNHLEQLYKNGYTLDMVFLLKMIENEEDVVVPCQENIKLEVLYHSLIRKGLITDSGSITNSGKDLLQWMKLEESQPVKLTRKRVSEDPFNTWWNTYPATDTFTYKNKFFEGTRSLRAKKEDCKIKLNKIINEGEYTIEEMLDALKFEVTQKKENSIKTKTNKLSYMQNSLTYLNQRTFESFIDLIREGGMMAETKENYDGINL